MFATLAVLRVGDWITFACPSTRIPVFQGCSGIKGSSFRSVGVRDSIEEQALIVDAG